MISMETNDRYYYHTDQRSHSLCLCTCGHDRSAGAYSWGPGKRPYYCLSCVESGTADYLYDGSPYKVRPGDIFVAFPDRMQYVSSSDPAWEYRWVGFTGSEAAALLHKMGFTESNPVLHISSSEEIGQHFLRIYSLRGSRLSDSMAMTGALYILFSELYKCLDCDHDIQPDIMQRALDYIDGHWQKNLEITDICRAVNVSRSWLYRQFMKNVGESPIQYVMHERLNHSCYYLRNSGLTVSEIAAACGFADPLYYSRMFKKQFGIPPTGYRNHGR